MQNLLRPVPESKRLGIVVAVLSSILFTVSMFFLSVYGVEIVFLEGTSYSLV